MAGRETKGLTKPVRAGPVWHSPVVYIPPAMSGRENPPENGRTTFRPGFGVILIIVDPVPVVFDFIQPTVT